jgi:hypothetical protein
VTGIEQQKNFCVAFWLPAFELVDEGKEKKKELTNLLSISLFCLSLIAFLSVAQQQHFWVCRLLFWLLPVLRLFAEEDYDHDLFGHIGSHLGLYHWRILWIVIRFLKKKKLTNQLPNQKLHKRLLCVRQPESNNAEATK